MRRTYISAVILLLGLGVISTLAISYNTATLEESWGIQYTLDYADAELSLSAPTTTLINSTAIQVSMTASHSQPTVQSSLVIIAQDGNGDPISTDGTGASVTVRFRNNGLLIEQVVYTLGDGVDYESTHAMTSAAEVDQVIVIWSKQDGLQAEYESAQITVTDV